MTMPLAAAGSSRRVMSPGLRRLLAVVLALVGLLGVNSLYLGGVTLAESLTGRGYQDHVYLGLFLLHLLLGLLLLPAFLLFGLLHMRRALRRSNRNAIRAGLGVYLFGLLTLGSGVLLTRFGFFEVNDPGVRGVAYWLHLLAPLLAAWLFVLHRLAGRAVRWRGGIGWGAFALAFAVLMLVWHGRTPEAPGVAAALPFYPALSRIEGGRPAIPPRHLMDDDTCAECHGDIVEQAKHGMHKLSSFNNPAYRFAVEEARQVLAARDGHLDVTRLCAACHDQVPLFDGRFTDPAFDPDTDPTAGAGITCIGCHAISAVNSPRGNGDYTIADPARYPFAFSERPWLKALNRQLIKAKPAFHKRTFLKPLHKSAEFCSVCHKVALPYALNHYKWLRGQDHYDSFLLSGVSGHRVDSFYYPPRAVDRCAVCHMRPVPSADPAARDFGGAGVLSVHGHGFPAGNTGVPHLLGLGASAQAERRAMLEGSARVDIFAVKQGGRIDGALSAPLRPRLPVLQPGEDYLLETVVRTLKLGHHLTQGTADSNELWLQVDLYDGDRRLAGSGTLDALGEVDPWAYFLNAYVLDADGNRVLRRNAQDIRVALYDHQIPPGAASVVHYRLRVPERVHGPLRVEVKLQYRKFNTAYTRLVQGEAFRRNDLPIVTLGADRVVLPVAGAAAPTQTSTIPLWERWNDYGIGLLREGGNGELRQAEAAFRAVEALGREEGVINRVRVYVKEGRVEEAARVLADAAGRLERAQPWTAVWFGALVKRELGDLDGAIADLRTIAETGFPAARARGFDFSYDIRVLNELGRSLYERARQARGSGAGERRRALLHEGRDWLERALLIDPEDVSAHFNLARIHQELGDAEAAARHRALHAQFKPDDQVVERAVSLHRRRNPAADHAAAAVVIYDLNPVADVASRPQRVTNHPNQ